MSTTAYIDGASGTGSTVFVSPKNPLPVTLPGAGGGGGGAPNVVTPFSRVAAATTTFTPATTGYTAGQDIGGALSLAGGVGNSTPIRVRSVTVAWTTASTSANGGIDVLLFSAAPTSTIADGSVTTWIAADAARYNGTIPTVSVLPATSTGLFYMNGPAAAANPSIPALTTTDPSGNVNIVLFDVAAITYTTPTTATVRVVFEY